MNDPWFRRHRTRVRLEDGRLGWEDKAPIDSLWSVTLDDGQVLFYSAVSRPGKDEAHPNYREVGL